MKYALLACTIFGLMASCNSDLTEEERRWLPYKKGDILVFESSKHQIDSIYISDITRSYVHDCEILEVKSHYLEKNTTSNGTPDTVHSFIMALTAGKENNAVFTFNLNRKFAQFGPFVAKRLTRLDSMELTTMDIQNRRYTDVLILEPDESHSKSLNAMRDSTFVKKVYWSKSHGLIRFDLLNDSVSWVMTRKYRL